MDSILELQEWVRQVIDQKYGTNPGPNGEAPMRYRIAIEPYAYPFQFTNLAVGQTQTQNLLINANADFVATRISYYDTATLGAAATVGTKPVSNVLMQITDQGSARPFFAAPMAMENFATNANPQRFLPYPRWLTANTALSLTATSFEAANASYIYGVIEGVRVYQFSPGG